MRSKSEEGRGSHASLLAADSWKWHPVSSYYQKRWINWKYHKMCGIPEVFRKSMSAQKRPKSKYVWLPYMELAPHVPPIRKSSASNVPVRRNYGLPLSHAHSINMYAHWISLTLFFISNLKQLLRSPSQFDPKLGLHRSVSHHLIPLVLKGHLRVLYLEMPLRPLGRKKRMTASSDSVTRILSSFPHLYALSWRLFASQKRRDSQMKRLAYGKVQEGAP